MEPIPIGEAAHQLGLNSSALRYYDERGLAPARTRRGGSRVYGRDELRRLAFIKITHRLGIPLETAAAILDAPVRGGATSYESRLPSWITSSPKPKGHKRS